MRALAAVSFFSSLFNTAAPATVRCLAGQYRLPESIAEDMRPYLVCGLMRGRDGHSSVRLNGQDVSMRGPELDSCDRIRQSAVEASGVRLAAAIPDADARQSFISTEFEKADQFLRAAALSGDLTVGEEPVSPQCRTSNAKNQ
jgi:hypothetical protein